MSPLEINKLVIPVRKDRIGEPGHTVSLIHRVVLMQDRRTHTSPRPAPLPLLVRKRKRTRDWGNV